MATTEKDKRKIELALQAKLEASRAETNTLRSDLNAARHLAADSTAEKLAARLANAEAQVATLENERERLTVRVTEITKLADKRELDLQVLQLVINESVDKLGAHTNPELRWWR